jgi:beta-N-acetylhexosaminidase
MKRLILLVAMLWTLANASAPHPGQFMVLPFEGTAPPWELLERYRPAGVILFASNFEGGNGAAMLRALREAYPELLIFVDQEGGPFMSYRTPEVVRFPSAMALGAADDVLLAEAVGEAIGQQLCAIGIDVNLAPVMDVNVNPDNPIIGLRSFGSQPQRVTSLALAFARGLARAGVLVTAKHFPGHGDTDVDSHHGLPIVAKPLGELEAVEFYPFARAVEHGIPLIMSAHILYPALDPAHPATLSRAVLQGLLRERMGFEGVIITDDMRMRAIRDRYPNDEAVVMAVQAGVDLVLVGRSRSDAEATYQALARALATGAISAERALASAARVDALRAQRASDCAEVERERIAALALEVARRSVTYLDGALPIPGEGTLVVAPRVSNRYGLEPSLAELAPQHLPGSRGLVTGERPSLEELARALELAAGAERVVLGTYHWLTPLPREQLALYDALRALGKPLYVVALGNPTDLVYFDTPPDGYLATYGYREVQLVAALETLSGVNLPTGTLPMAVGPYPRGAGGLRLLENR